VLQYAKPECSIIRYHEYMVTLIVFLLLFSVGDGVLDDDYLPLSYAGLWTIQEDEYAYGDSWRYSDDGSLTFSFVGDGFALFAPRWDGGGDGEVCINDECLVVSWFSPVTVHGVEIVAATDLGDGQHTITISTDTGAIAVDALYIAPPAPTITTTDNAALANLIFQAATFTALLAFGAIFLVRGNVK
jgi:hypothetical protein